MKLRPKQREQSFIPAIDKRSKCLRNKIKQLFKVFNASPKRCHCWNEGTTAFKGTKIPLSSTGDSWAVQWEMKTLFVPTLKGMSVSLVAKKKKTTTNKHTKVLSSNWIRQIVWGALIASFVWICHLAGWPLRSRSQRTPTIRLVRHSLRDAWASVLRTWRIEY